MSLIDYNDKTLITVITETKAIKGNSPALSYQVWDAEFDSRIKDMVKIRDGKHEFFTNTIYESRLRLSSSIPTLTNFTRICSVMRL
jgi:hypothetical protein